MKKKKPREPRRTEKPVAGRIATCVAFGAAILALGTLLGLGRIGGDIAGVRPEPAGFPVRTLANGVWEKPRTPGESEALVFEGVSEGGFSGKIRLYSAAPEKGAAGAPAGEGWEEVTSADAGSNVKLYRNKGGRMRIVVADPIGGDAAAIAVFEGKVANRGDAAMERPEFQGKAGQPPPAFP